MSGKAQMILVLLLSAGAAACRSPGKEQYLQRADALSRDGKWADALAQYQKALEIDPGDGEGRVRLADAMEHATPADVQGIRRERVRAAAALPRNNDAQFKAGAMLVDIRRWDEAELRADLILKNDPDSWQGRLLKGEIAAGRN